MEIGSICHCPGLPVVLCTCGVPSPAEMWQFVPVSLLLRSSFTLVPCETVPAPCPQHCWLNTTRKERTRQRASPLLDFLLFVFTPSVEKKNSSLVECVAVMRSSIKACEDNWILKEWNQKVDWYYFFQHIIKPHVLHWLGMHNLPSY